LRPTPDLGEHSEEVLRELGYNDAAIADLRAREVV
jgi:formyl-CoA transferase